MVPVMDLICKFHKFFLQAVWVEITAITQESRLNSQVVSAALGSGKWALVQVEGSSLHSILHFASMHLLGRLHCHIAINDGTKKFNGLLLLLRFFVPHLEYSQSVFIGESKNKGNILPPYRATLHQPFSPLLLTDLQRSHA